MIGVKPPLPASPDVVPERRSWRRGLGGLGDLLPRGIPGVLHVDALLYAAKPAIGKSPMVSRASSRPRSAMTRRYAGKVPGLCSPYLFAVPLGGHGFPSPLLSTFTRSFAGPRQTLPAMTRRGSHGQRDRLSSVVKTAGEVASPFGAV